MALSFSVILGHRTWPYPDERQRRHGTRRSALLQRCILCIWRLAHVAGQFRPSSIHNAFDLGASSKRYDDVYATNGTIQTSDQRDKKDVTDLDLGLEFVNALRPVSFVWDDRGGHVGSREHMGFITQEVASTLGDQLRSCGVD